MFWVILCMFGLFGRRRIAGPSPVELGAGVDLTVRAGVPAGRRHRDDRAVLHPYPRRRFHLFLLRRQPHLGSLDEPRSPLLRRDRRTDHWRRRTPAGRRASCNYRQRSADDQSQPESANRSEIHLTPLTRAAPDALVLETHKLRHHYIPWNSRACASVTEAYVFGYLHAPAAS